MVHTIDEEFLQWWEKRLEEDGHDLDRPQLRIAAHPTKVHLQNVYSYREFFQAVREREYWPLVAYQVAYHFTGHKYKSPQEEIPDNVLAFPGKSGKPTK